MILPIGQIVRFSNDFINRMGCPQYAKLTGKIDSRYGEMAGVTWENGVSTGGSIDCFQQYQPAVDSIIKQVQQEAIVRARRLFLESLK